MTAKQIEFTGYVLRYLGATPTVNNIRLFFAWIKKELRNPNVTDGNNFLNTSWKDTDSTTFNSHGVQNYRSLERGAQLTAKTIQQSYGNYQNILQGIKAGAPPELIAKNYLSEFSKWGTGDLTQVLKNTPVPTPSEIKTIQSIYLSTNPNTGGGGDTVKPGTSAGAIVLIGGIVAALIFLSK